MSRRVRIWNRRAAGTAVALWSAAWLGALVPGTPRAATEFVATLDGASVFPPTISPATGSASFILDDAGINISYTVEFSGLLSPEVAAHIHNAAPGEVGTTVFFLPTGSPKTGVLMFVTPDMVAELFAGRLYINIHTSKFPEGEIRGNLHLSISPTEPSTWGKIKALYR
ncbi:MAG: CHRD domain-containing protein [Candidatus Krumholzibacteria bacterium]